MRCASPALSRRQGPSDRTGDPYCECVANRRACRIPLLRPRSQSSPGSGGYPGCGVLRSLPSTVSTFGCVFDVRQNQVNLMIFFSECKSEQPWPVIPAVGIGIESRLREIAMCIGAEFGHEI